MECHPGKLPHPDALVTGVIPMVKVRPPDSKGVLDPECEFYEEGLRPGTIVTIEGSLPGKVFSKGDAACLVFFFLCTGICLGLLWP